MNEYNDVVLPAKHDLEPHVMDKQATTRKRAIIFMALINVGKWYQKQQEHVCYIRRMFNLF